MRIQWITTIWLLGALTNLVSHAYGPISDKIEKKMGDLDELHLLLSPLAQLEKQALNLQADAKIQGSRSAVFAKTQVLGALLEKIEIEIDGVMFETRDKPLTGNWEEASLFLERLGTIVDAVLEDPGHISVINKHRYNHQQGIQQTALWCWSFVSGACALSGPACFIGSVGISATGTAWKAYDRFCRDTKTFLLISELKKAIKSSRDALALRVQKLRT